MSGGLFVREIVLGVQSYCACIVRGTRATSTGDRGLGSTMPECPDYKGGGVEEPVFTDSAEGAVASMRPEKMFQDMTSVHCSMCSCRRSGPGSNCWSNGIEIRVRREFLAKKPCVSCQGQKLAERRIVERQVAMSVNEFGW